MPNPEPYRVALRLTFAYEGDSPRYVGMRRVEMTLPPSHPTADYQDRGGFWFELRDSAGKTLYGRRLHDPMPAYAEAFSRQGAIAWTPVADGRGTFEVLVPALGQPTTLFLFGPPPPLTPAAAATALTSGPPPATGKTAELVRVDLAADKP